mmetsp:Transcript_33980/g.90548  ORF Transcript_33980/g.90548 Transcript_33980/m.90548 type:complete len:96 (-) Transcript_33980:66-353(-)
MVSRRKRQKQGGHHIVTSKTDTEVRGQARASTPHKPPRRGLHRKARLNTHTIHPDHRLKHRRKAHVKPAEHKLTRIASNVANVEVMARGHVFQKS